MRFKVLFVAYGSIVIDADSQTEAKEKADALSNEQIVKEIDYVEIWDVVEEGE